MHKLQTLRLHLLSLSHLNLKEDSLHTFVEQQGKVISHQNAAPNSGLGADLSATDQASNRNFKYDYTASVIVTDYSEDFNVLAYEVIEWLDQHEPNRPTEAFTFSADILKNDAADVEVKLNLTELITVTRHDNGVSIDSHNCKRVSL